jgi:apolipoprotein N-acyltransferase
MTSNTSTRAALAVASGLALALAFPKFDLNLLAWIAFVPLLYAVEGEPPRRVLGYAFLQGFACYVASLYWIVITLHNFANVRAVLAILPMLLLAAVIATNTAVAIWAAEYSAARLQLPIIVTLPIVWTAVEWVRTYFPIGFPWNLLGYTAYRNLQLIQFAEFTGVYGVSALIIFFNAVVYVVVFKVASRRVQTIGLGVLTALMGLALIFGAWRSHRGGSGARLDPGRDGAGQYTSVDKMGPQVSRLELQSISRAEPGGGQARRRPYRVAGGGGRVLFSARRQLPRAVRRRCHLSQPPARTRRL